MKQGLQLRLGQQITMTPQLQQAIRLLQLSTLDLQLEIQQVLESNIMLEVAEDEPEEGDNPVNGNEEDFTETAVKEDEEAEVVPPDSFSDIPRELESDNEWEDFYDGSITQYDHPNNDNDKEKDFINQNSSQETLQQHLLWQLELTTFNEIDHAIAIAIIDAIDGSGYLAISLEEVIQSLGKNAPITIEEVEAVLRQVQRFDPVGVGARNLRECLLLQLEELDPTTLWRAEAQRLVSNCLEVLASRDYVQLAKCMEFDREKLKPVVDLIQSLNPRPGASLENHQITYVIPDVFVRKVNDQWKVELNAEISPKLRINSYYASLISQTGNRGDVVSLKSHLQEARWFIKSLKSRHETLLRVARCIVKRQSGFLNYGEEAMKPLILHDISSELDMHESTVSRVTTQKYIHTPRGIFELKYFFSSHVSTDGGGECSSTAIRALIKKLIATEDVAKPFSDDKISKLLSERGIKVARRTVAKYREALVIPPSNERKRLT
ncbi:MAG: RNA polymerase factor sigma-54 [Beggiatoa sp. IS2]|nr:MAG: RNA polymerase factor sigma-54 [Beggiatoa sp. IS2]